MVLHTLISTATTFLVVSGNRPEEFEKTHRLGADIVIIDLKDAVSSKDKALARENAAAWLTANPDEATVVRIHPIGSVEYERDVALLSRCAKAIMLPQTEHAEDLHLVQKQLGKIAVIAVIESFKGVLHAQHIASAPGVIRLAFGSFDYTAERDVRPDDHHAQLLARSTLVLASSVAQLAGPIDAVMPDSEDESRIRPGAEYGRNLGFAGKLCAHPCQVNAVRLIYMPTADEIAWAKLVLAKATEAATSIDGAKPVDQFVIVQAEHLLAQVKDPNAARLHAAAGQSPR
ncbi:CoA ester lyase [Pseudomonas sp. A2]|uniref:HpcH/HpaI aldolase/citrate lyase family protein n=1 Tax=Pseudomonas sp. A2 TaxID=107445 RepID=UPI002D0FBD7C|nr:CoA ester lyase [Pseudomonas sp. A2]MEB3438099.1 CoA ester lyase [Pseudomonas sp. A2]